ncbi:MAG: ABC transporter permease subunit [Candidatus Thorarchaeota archaeon]
MQLATTPSNPIIVLLQIDPVHELYNGFMTTMGLYLFAIILGLGLGIILAVVRYYGGSVTSRIATAYIEFFRGTPLLAQILTVIFFPPALNAWLVTQGIAPIDTNWEIILPDPWGIPSIFLNTRLLLCAITLTLNSAAYQAEYFRGALGSLSAGQSLAASSIGMTKRQEIRYIALPQSLRRAIPAWSNEAAYLPKYVTVCYIVGVEDLFGKATLISTRTYQVLPVYITVAIIFLILITTISLILNYIYNRMKIPGI